MEGEGGSHLVVGCGERHHREPQHGDVAVHVKPFTATYGRGVSGLVEALTPTLSRRERGSFGDVAVHVKPFTASYGRGLAGWLKPSPRPSPGGRGRALGDGLRKGGRSATWCSGCSTRQGEGRCRPCARWRRAPTARNPLPGSRSSRGRSVRRLERSQIG